MPSRSSVKTVPTPVEIMGDDAYVKYRPITMNEARDIRQKSNEMQKQVDKVLSEYASSVNKQVNNLTDAEKEQAYFNAGLTDDIISFADKEFSKYILDWNWVYENGEPMPIPSEDYTVLGKLYPHEYNYIMSLFNPDDNSAKN